MKKMKKKRKKNQYDLDNIKPINSWYPRRIRGKKCRENGEASLPDLLEGEKRAPHSTLRYFPKKARVIPRLCSNCHESLPAE